MDLRNGLYQHLALDCRIGRRSYPCSGRCRDRGGAAQSKKGEVTGSEWKVHVVWMPIPSLELSTNPFTNLPICWPKPPSRMNKPL